MAKKPKQSPGARYFYSW